MAVAMPRGISLILVGCFIALLAFVHCSYALPFYSSGFPSTRHKDYLIEVEDPDAVLEMLAKLGQNVLRTSHDGSNSKRGLDLGLGRGFSGSQAAKHLMGLAAANFAAGPGKKKRVPVWNPSYGFAFNIPLQDNGLPPTSNEWMMATKE